MSEIWKLIPGWPHYEASDHGRVRSVDHWAGSGLPGKGNYERRIPGCVLAHWKHSKSGHFYVKLKDAGCKESRRVHNLVMEAHGPSKPSPVHEVRHLDGDETNNRMSNLEWATRRRNAQDRKWHKGHGHHKLKPFQVLEIRAALATGAYGIGRTLACRYGVTESAISAIKCGRVHEDVL